MPADPRALLIRVLLCALALGSAAPTASPASAQEGDTEAADEWRVGGSLGVPGARLEAFFPAFTVGLHLLHLPPGRVAFDASVGVAPMLLAEGSLALGARSGISFPTGSRPEGIFGGYVGGAVVAGSGLRTGVTFHWLGGSWPVAGEERNPQEAYPRVAASASSSSSS